MRGAMLILRRGLVQALAWGRVLATAVRCAAHNHPDSAAAAPCAGPRTARRLRRLCWTRPSQVRTPGAPRGSALLRGLGWLRWGASGPCGAVAAVHGLLRAPAALLCGHRRASACRPGAPGRRLPSTANRPPRSHPRQPCRRARVAREDRHRRAPGHLQGPADADHPQHALSGRIGGPRVLRVSRQPARPALVARLAARAALCCGGRRRAGCAAAAQLAY